MNFGVCDFSRFAGMDWRLRRWRLCFSALMPATLLDNNLDDVLNDVLDDVDEMFWMISWMMF